MDNTVLTILTAKEFGINKEEKLEVLKKYGDYTSVTDVVILTGGKCYETEKEYIYHTVPDDSSLKGRVGFFWTKSNDSNGKILADNGLGEYPFTLVPGLDTVAIRPVLESPKIFSEVYPKRVKGYNDIEEVEFGEYPQYVTEESTKKILEKKYWEGTLKKTGKKYILNTDETNEDHYFESKQKECDEFEYNGKKYVRMRANYLHRHSFLLSNGEVYIQYDWVWVEVSPVVWLIDEENKKLISKRGLLSGVKFDKYMSKYDGDFSKTTMYEYMNKYMLHDIINVSQLNQNVDEEEITNEVQEEQNFLTSPKKR